MFDGIKIDCRGVNPLRWIDNDLFKFIGCFEVRTGEILRHPYEANHEGLKIRVIPSTVNESLYHGVINGSLHKHFNRGLHNANDFHLSDVETVINGLCRDFGINQESIIRNLEFGVNIEIPIQAKDFIKKIVSTPKGKVFDFKVHGKKVGKYFAPTQGQYEVKIYDKSAAIEVDPDQSNTPPQSKNLLRIEVKAKEMRFLKPYDITKLSDLLVYNKVEKLGMLLVSMFNKLIINDMDTSKLSEKQLSRAKDFINPLFWQELTHRQRDKQLLRYRELSAIAISTDIQNTISKLILSKWNELLNMQPITGGIYGNFSAVNVQPKKGGFTALEYRPYFTPLEQDINQFLPTPKNDQKTTPKRYCKICGLDITHRNAKSLYCSKKCANKVSGIFRHDRRELKRTFEIKYMNLLKRKKERALIEICRLTTTTGTVTTCKLDELIMNPAEIRKVTKIDFIRTTTPAALTTQRAKQFIRYATNLNLTNKTNIHESE